MVKEAFMPDMLSQRFVRVPTELLEAVLRLHLTGAQWRILFWVIRQTLGWNRHTISFSWYRMARELSLDRGGVARSGRTLIHSGILVLAGKQIGIQPNPAAWTRMGSPSADQATSIETSDAAGPRNAKAAVIVSEDERPRNRGQKSSLFRHAKDSIKERSKTYKEKLADKDWRHSFQHGALSQHHPAGEARAIPGKYDRISQD